METILANNMSKTPCSIRKTPTGGSAGFHGAVVLLVFFLVPVFPLFSQTPGAPATPAVAAKPAELPLPDSPHKLFEDLVKETKPMWRSQYRERLERTLPSRQKTAFAIGALMADLDLAATARDTQQVRNLCQELETFERALAIADKMTTARQKLLSNAEAQDWEATIRSIDHAFQKQMELLTSLRDNDLVCIELVARWVRTWQICTNLVIQRKLFEKDHLAIGSLSYISQLQKKLELLVASDSSPEKCIRNAARRFSHLERLWTIPASDPAARLQSSAELFKEMLAPLIQAEPKP
jgi:hypothetical protein